MMPCSVKQNTHFPVEDDLMLLDMGGGNQDNALGI